MPLDSIFVTALAAELSGTLEGSRIDKVFMPSADEVHFTAHGPAGKFRLLINGGTLHPRVHLTDISRENPAAPPMFCMLLRKHMTGGRFVKLYQPPLERVICLTWECADEMGGLSHKTVVCEMMGRHSNIILVDAEGRISDCLRRVDSEMSEQRPVLPGLFYALPPKQDKNDPFAVTEREFAQMLAHKPPDKPPVDWLLDTFAGLSPLVCRHLAAAPDMISERFFELASRVGRRDFSPCVLLKEGEPKDFCALPITAAPLETALWEGTLSALLDSVYTTGDNASRLRQRAQGMVKTAENNRDRLLRKIALQEAELAAARDRERLREQGDLLMANMHLIEKGQSAVTVENFYHPEQAQITIPLDPARSPHQNATRFYKAYAKAKNAEAVLGEQIERARTDAEYWESVIEQLLRVTGERDLEEIREELHPARQVKGRQPKLSLPHCFVSSEGVRFFAGRNNRQNDLLTLKTAAKSDTWLHTQKIPGCHVVIENTGTPIGEQTIFEAATVAAFFSKAKNSPKVPVDYTLVKNVKKPPGAKPGMVIYSRFQTMLVQPDGELVRRLMK